MFSDEKKGYNKKEVDKKINEMLTELTNLKQKLIEKDKLNIGLACALEKAKEIEVSAQHLFELKTQKIQIICQNLEKRFQKLFKIYPQIEEFDDIKVTFDEFSAIVSDAFSPQPKKITAPVKTENDTFRLLLNKMSSYSQPVEQAKKPATKRTTTKKTASDKTDKFYEKPSLIKPIYDGNQDDFESLADKFLESNEHGSSVYEKIIHNRQEDDLYPTPNESGFDLKEAVNPKDDLEEIMKAFNFDE